MDDWCSVAGFFQETIGRLSPVHVIAAGSLKALQSLRGCKEMGGNDSERRILILVTMTSLYIIVVQESQTQLSSSSKPRMILK